MPQVSLIARKAFTFERRALKVGDEFLANRRDAKILTALRVAKPKGATFRYTTVQVGPDLTGVDLGSPVMRKVTTIRTETEETMAVPAVRQVPLAPEVPEPNKVDEPMALIEPTKSPETEEGLEQRIERAMEPEEPVAPRVKRRYRRRDIAPSETK
jgi:hypothetical protein